MEDDEQEEDVIEEGAAPPTVVVGAPEPAASVSVAFTDADVDRLKVAELKVALKQRGRLQTG